MSRLPRIDLPGYPQHIIQRGNNRQPCFADAADFKAYANWLKIYSQKFDVAIHAWVFMTNHVHLLCTAHCENGISNMMQGLGREYVRYFNYKYKRTGTLWEGRFKSCLVQTESYLIQLYKYIEMNPVRANMVQSPDEYSWSSYQINALGKQSSLCKPHEVYTSLSNNESHRYLIYQQLFQQKLPDSVIENIRHSLNSGLAFGNEDFLTKVENDTGFRTHLSKRGRPLGWRKK